MKNVIIIGNGITGITAARHIRKLSDVPITVVSSESNYFFSRTALMYIYMGQLKFRHTKPYEDRFWKKNKISLVRAHVERVDTLSKTLFFTDGGKLQYEKLIIASGSVYNKFGWPGQDMKGVSGLYSLQDLKQTQRFTKNIENAVIVGGGLIGIELAEMLRSQKINVTMLVRENRYWGNVLPEEEARFIEKHINKHKVEVLLNTQLKEILGNSDGRVQAVVTDAGKEIPCSFVGLTAGVSPNIDFLKGSGIDCREGILVDDFLETSITGIYAAGDCAEFRKPLPGRKKIEPLWYTGRMMGETLAKTICGEKTKYDPGIWFNSAKFFDIEYQTYGRVWSEPHDDESSFFWEDSQSGKFIKIVYDKKNHVIKGINAFGIRLRHSVCESWIKKGITVNKVLENLNTAVFDAEFSKDLQPGIFEKFRISGKSHNF